MNIGVDDRVDMTDNVFVQCGDESGGGEGGEDGDIVGADGLMCAKYESNITTHRTSFARIMSGGTSRPGSSLSSETKGTSSCCHCLFLAT